MEYNFNSIFLDLLGVALIVLKLLNKIQMSWIWVLCPIWIPLVVAFILIVYNSFNQKY